MKAGPLLVPNLGAEEDGDWRAGLREPRVRTAARLWRWLFAETAVVAESAVASFDVRPESLADCSGAAFEWLDRPEACFGWLSTPDAQRVAESAGRPLHGPAPEVVRRVHDKAFALRGAEQADLVPRSLRGTARIFEPEQLADPAALARDLATAVAAWPDWTEARFTLKPRRGTSGRGRLDGNARDLDAAKLRKALPRLARQGGAVLEPWLDRTADLSAQVCIGEGGEVRLLGSLELLTRPSGGYRGHRGEVDGHGRIGSGHAHDEALRGAAAQMAALAREAGFHGPGGLDALCFRRPGDPEGVSSLRPVVEWNARFTMGTVAIGLVRRLLPRLRSELALGPDDRLAFRFELDQPDAGWDAAREAAGPGAALLPLGFEGEPTRPAILFGAAGDPEAERT